MLRSPLVHFILVGALLFGLKSTWASHSEPTVVEILRSEIDEQISTYQKQVGREPNAAELRSLENQVVENALWLEQARALGLHRTDLVVRQRLIRNMRFLDGPIDASDDELFRKAVALGMDQSDIVVQRRLIDRVQAMIRAGVRSRNPDKAHLRAHYEKTASRWREPVLLDFTHVYFSRDKRGDRAKLDAAARLSELTRMHAEPEIAVLQGDAFLSGHRLRSATPNRIVARFGPVFAVGVEHQPTLRWVGPIESAFGAHLVWIHERIASRIRPFDEVGKAVLEDWIKKETDRALRAQIERRRQIVEVRVIEDPKTSLPAMTRASGGGR